MNKKLLEELSAIFINAGLNEKLAYSIYSEILLEQARKASLLQDKIADISLPLQEHIIKLLMFKSDNENKSHWIIEVATYCNIFIGRKIRTSKGAKLPTKYQLIDWLEVLTETGFKNVAGLLNRKYKRNEICPSYDLFLSVIEKLISYQEPLSYENVENIFENNS